VDDAAVQRHLHDLKRGKLPRADLIIATPEMERAVDQLELAEHALTTWSDHARLQLTHTGVLPQPPDEARGFSADHLRAITGGLLPA
jgi:hypothetical protein